MDEFEFHVEAYLEDLTFNLKLTVLSILSSWMFLSTRLLFKQLICHPFMAAWEYNFLQE